MSSINQLLFAEAILKGSAGLLLVLLPGITLSALGLTKSTSHFWPRMLGALLLGLAAATVLEGSHQAKTGLGLAGSIVINLSGIFVLGSHLILAQTAPTRRGRILLWGLVILLALLTLLEFAVAT